jgi:hypothetical protein
MPMEEQVANPVVAARPSSLGALARSAGANVSRETVVIVAEG